MRITLKFNDLILKKTRELLRDYVSMTMLYSTPTGIAWHFLTFFFRAATGVKILTFRSVLSLLPLHRLIIFVKVYFYQRTVLVPFLEPKKLLTR